MKRLSHPGFMVCSPKGRTPRYQHATLTDAREEAKRLASVEPGQPFYILAPIGGGIVDRPEPVMFSLPILPDQHEDLDAEIPF